jgi:hypothetical protein
MEGVKMKCNKCDTTIPQERLDALPDTKTCVKCSEVRPMVGVTVWNKTSQQLVITDVNGAKEFWHYEVGDGRFSRF